MATDRQIAANRQHAQHSTGPRTPEGQARKRQQRPPRRKQMEQTLSGGRSLRDRQANYRSSAHATAMLAHDVTTSDLEAPTMNAPQLSGTLVLIRRPSP
jgi:hypothetical protein